MKGALVFLAVFALVLIISLGYSGIPPGQQIYEAMGGVGTDYPILGIPVSTLVPACLNGIIYGIIAWIIYSVTAGRKTQKVEVQVDVNAKATETKPKESLTPPQTKQTQVKEKEDILKETEIKTLRSIEEIEGIGSTYAKKLNEAGIRTTADLLEAGGTPKGRALLAETSGISGTLILEWVNLADLFRIKGVGEEYSDLLEEAGVDTVVELARRNAENLHAKLCEVNETKHLVRRVPTLNEVTQWIEQAKTLPRKIEY